MGLFCREAVEAHQVVIEFLGEVIRDRLADYREAQYDQQGIGSSYLFRLDNHTVLDATHRGAITRYMNHCCEPNCYASVIAMGGGVKRIFVFSKREIAAGEEITYDYSFPKEDDPSLRVKCLCGHPNCRKYLN